MVFNLNTKRRRSLLLCLFLASLVLTSSSIGYFCQNLDIVRLGMILLALSFPFFYPALHLYVNDLVPASLVPSKSVFLILFSMVADTSIPIVFNFEGSSYNSVGLKFAFLAFLGFVSLGILFCFMIETEGLTREEVRLIHDGRWGWGESKQGYFDLDNIQTEEDDHQEGL